jgi:dethiobiotin synthetase
MKIFVTAIDTNVGKTIVSSALCSGLNYAYWKPIQCGDLDDSDSMKIKKYSPETLVYPELFKLKAPMSPHEAAKREKVNILLESFESPQSNNIIIEGAGGVMVPLNYDGDLMLDLANKISTGTIVVFKNYLGSINHTILTIKQLKSKGINVLGLILIGERSVSSESIIEKVTQTKILAHLPYTNNITSEWVKIQGKLMAENISNEVIL